MKRFFLLAFAVLVHSGLAVAQTQAAARYNALGSSPMTGFYCQQNQCGGSFGWLNVAGAANLGGAVNTSGDVHGGTLTADGAMTSGSVSSGAISGTDISASSATLSGSVSAANANVSGTTTTGNATIANNLSAQNANFTTITAPGFSSDSSGQVTFAKPPMMVTTTICTTTSAPVSISVLNTATTVTTLSSRFFTLGAPCFVVPPPGLNLNVDYSCRVATAGIATIYVKAGLVGLSASSGQWCAMVVGG